MKVFKRVAASARIRRLFSVALVLARLRKRCEQCRQTVVERKERRLMMEQKAREELEVCRKNESTKQVSELNELGNIQELARNARDLEERTRRDLSEKKPRDERDNGVLTRQHSRKSDSRRTRPSRQHSSNRFRSRKEERLLRDELNRERHRANERERWLVQQLEEARDVGVSEREKLRIKSEAHNIVMEAFQADLEYERRTVSNTRRKLDDAERENEELRGLLHKQKEEMKSAQSMKEANFQRERRMRQDLEELTYAHRQACDKAEQARGSLSSMQEELLERIRLFEIENERRDSEVMEIHREFIQLKDMVHKLQKTIQVVREDCTSTDSLATQRLIQDNQPDPVELELEIVQKKLEKTEMKLKEVERNIKKRSQKWDVDQKRGQSMVDNAMRDSNTDTSSTDNSSK